MHQGAVPQAIDWLRAWQAARSPRSWSASAAELRTEHFAHTLRERLVSNKALQAQARVMQEVVRESARVSVRLCVSICLDFDDRDGYKLDQQLRGEAMM